MNVKRYLDLAAGISRRRTDDRTYFLGAVGIREDGAMVSAYNGAPKYPCPEHHCESRLCRKLGAGGTVFLARTLADGSWANAMPCGACQRRLAHSKTRKVVFTIGPGAYSTWEPS